ncbi:HD-GYP domain-containing protein [Isachenkonia alkalipeptolytica]|uniref:HD-GYP domain-containing protein n=1 Tax=Isachenkonia alkalipeptolytica TaxID=2565777 RepID=A0AA43XL40_9CLOT|nr:HD-GYP domain-containing protein [Isachenkonia alkalipeptolytica]NBG88712.1 HD-GYP domain-containing protein [Isachenkonia alkalipeptolytica]
MTMRIKAIKELHPGQILGQTLYTEKGDILLRKGVYISPFIIKKLQESGYASVYIWEDTMEYELEDVIRPEIRQKAINDLRKFTKAIEGEDPKRAEANMSILRAEVSTVVDELFNQKEVVVELVDMKNINRGLYQHSVNVMIHSVILAVGLGLNKTEVGKVALGALLHDIGLLFMPTEIMKKEGPLTPEEFEQIKEHPKKGFEFLRDKLNVEATTRMGILDHHEQYDGSGYPAGKKGTEIHLYGRIIAVANKYDSIISDRHYKKAMPVAEALEYIMGGGGSVFDPELTRIFIRNVNPYPVNTLVELSDGNVAAVVEVHSSFFSRPVVKVIRGKDKGEKIDLLREKNRVIINTL